MSDGPVAPPVGRLLVWRHGRTEWNASGRFQGQLDPPLDDEGRAQAAWTAPQLAGGLPAGDTVLLSSDLRRARQTADALAPLLGVEVRVDERLREHSLGRWEGLTRTEVAERYPEQYADWVAGHPVRGRGGEAAEAVAARALAAVAALPPARTAVLVTHGGTAGRLIEALLGMGVDQRRVFGPLGNCHWSDLSVQGSRWRLMRHNVSAVRTGTPASPDAPVAAAPAAAPSGDGRATPAGRSPAGPAEVEPMAQDADATL